MPAKITSPCKRVILTAVFLWLAVLLPAAADEIKQDSFAPYFGSFWYGVYLQGNKVGHLHAVIGRLEEKNDSPYLFKMAVQVQIRSMKQEVSHSTRAVGVFDPNPPYALQRYHVSNNSDGKSSLIRIQRDPDKTTYTARILQANQSRTQAIDALDYTFADFLAVERWLEQRPEVKETITHNDINTDRLRVEQQESEVVAIRPKVIDGVQEHCYEVETSSSDGRQTSFYTSSGKLIEGRIGGFLEIRWESEETARQRDKAVDVFSANMVKVAHPLGPTGEISLLELSVAPEFGKQLTPASGQELRFDRETQRYRVLIRQGVGPHIKATAEEIETNLAVTVSCPHDNPAVKALAVKAVEDARLDREKVDRLVHFVSSYVRDTMNPAQVGLIELLETRKGDCTEHAMLLTGLARSLGIPARTVGGIGYTNDKLQAFGGHAWNEVVIDGYWVPVDPTWNETRISASHLRLPIQDSDRASLLALVPKADLQLIRVQGKEFLPHRLMDQGLLDELEKLLKDKPDRVNKVYVTAFADGTVVHKGTLLHYAVRNENREAVKLLLRLGAKPDQTNSRGQTVFELAREVGNRELLKLLGQ